MQSDTQLALNLLTAQSRDPGPSCMLLGDEIRGPAAQWCTLQEPLRHLTSRPALAHLRDMNAGNVELLRAMMLEHEAYGRLAVGFTTRVRSAPIAMSHLPLLPATIPSILLTFFHAAHAASDLL